MFRDYRISVISAVLLIALLMAPVVYAQGGGDDIPRFDEAECPFDLPVFEDNIVCGYVEVPESRSEPDGPTIRLAIAILRSHSSSPLPDPVVYLEGGPGGSALDGVEFWVTTRFRDERDFILIDQRGTGFSEPGLHCPEYEQMAADTFDEVFETDDEVRDFIVEVAGDCRERLVGEGVNLAAYTSAESAADFADVRVALGYEEWNLYGISYGTRLAQTIMRDHPEGVRSVILDSTVALPAQAYEEGPLLAARAFGELFEGCAADADCNAAYPDLEADFYAFVEQTNEESIRVRLTNPYTGERVSVLLSGDDMLDVLFGALYDSSVIPFLPIILARAVDGDTRMLASYIDVQQKFQAEADFSLGMYYSVECSEELPFNDYAVSVASAAEYPELQGFLINQFDFDVCPLWGAAESNQLENESFESDIPTLIMAGQYDPITPPQWGQLAGETLANSYYFEFPGLGHGATIVDCPSQMAMAFVDNPAQPPDDACLQNASGPDFYTSNLIVLRKLYKLLEALLIDLAAIQYVVLGLGCVSMGMTFTVWPLIRIIHRLRFREERPSKAVQGASWLAALLALWNMLFLAALTVTVIITLSNNETLLLFGLPRWALPVMLMPYLSVVGTLLLLGLNVAVWREKAWRLFGRLLFSWISLLALGYVVWLIAWGFLIPPL